jgi:hypothetical protein
MQICPIRHWFETSISTSVWPSSRYVNMLAINQLPDDGDYGRVADTKNSVGK